MLPRTQFLVEAIVLSVIGGVAGVLCGGAAIYGLGRALDWNMGISPGALLVSVGTSAATGPRRGA